MNIACLVFCQEPVEVMEQHPVEDRALRMARAKNKKRADYPLPGVRPAFESILGHAREARVPGQTIIRTACRRRRSRHGFRRDRRRSRRSWACPSGDELR